MIIDNQGTKKRWNTQKKLTVQARCTTFQRFCLGLH